MEKCDGSKMQVEKGDAFKLEMLECEKVIVEESGALV